MSSRRDPRVFLWDAREAARDIERFCRGKAFEDYMAEELLRLAVERQLMIVGEALSQLRKADPVLAARIDALPAAIGMRHVLVHGYADLDHRKVWGVIEAALRPLIEQLDTLLGDER